ncbi:MAG TPA: ROK family transcriptional regulator [Actinocrinis sp.]|uniref:ROK family transcriptional regulator n=1 Tax=Actinocrinis sp. TaxID=1920516 RepID=UPI002D636422|nr:ROK family transcriptional regulator [Actinocrinis sp.]HZU56665.1 ROK family transcriptional regulator [Actinocrinis sp.]
MNHRTPRDPIHRRGASAGSVLRAILEHGPVPRSTIARLTGLSPASVTGHTAELAEQSFIRETSEFTRAKAVGRPHVPVDLDLSGYVVASVHIAVPHTTIALLDLRGRVLVRHQEPHVQPEPLAVIAQASEILARLLAEHSAGRTPLGLGVATGGWIDREAGILVEHPLLGWQDIALRDLFAERTGLLVEVDGHSRALLLAERLFGSARGRSSVMHLFIGNVVDAAFAAGESVHYGPRSQAGAIAHLPLPGNTEPCFCGRTGCLQAAVSEQSLARRAFDEGIVAEPEFPLLLETARYGEPGALRLFTERARHIGRATAMLTDVFGPELVVIVEPGVMFLPGTLSALHEEMRAHAWSPPADVTRAVVPTGFEPDSILAIAGGSVILDALYRDPHKLLAEHERAYSAAQRCIHI